MIRPFPPVPPLPLAEQRGESFPRLVELMQRLLAVDGCPWDREQSFETLRKYVVEEAHEVVDAIDSGDRNAVAEELGDLLLQVVFQAELGRAEGAFGPDDVVRGIVEKIVRRHPHVFEDVSVSGAEEVLENWEQIKAKEKGSRGLLGGVPKSMPALLRAQRIGEKVEKVGFDWPDITGSRAKVAEEIGELDEAIASGDAKAIQEELGDALFALVNLARHLDVDAEASLRGTIDKFTDRFNHVEARVKEKHGGFPRASDGKAGKGIVPGLVEALKHKAEGMRDQAAQVLGLLGEDAVGAVPALTGALKDRSAAVRASAAGALGAIGPEAKEAVKPLVALLKDEDEEARAAAARGLGGIGADAKEAADALLDLVKKGESSTRAAAAEALGKIGPDASKPPVVAALLDLLKKGEDEEARAAAAFGLGGLQAKGPGVVAALTGALGDKQEEVRAAAVAALGKLGAVEAKGAVAAVAKALGDKSEEVRLAAAEALGELGEAAKEAVPALTTALGDKADDVRAAAATALGAVGSAAKSAVPKLAEALGDSSAEVRDSALEALGLLGADAKEAAPAVRKLLASKDEALRESAEDVLKKIDPEKK